MKTSEAKRSQNQSTTRAHAEPSLRRSQTSPAPDKPKSGAQAAAEAAFEEGLKSGKAGEKNPERKKRRSSSSSSAHPKGTAVPPRARDAATGSTSDEGASKARRQQAPASSSGPPPSSESASGGQGASPSTPSAATPSTPGANNTEAKADVGVATQVNEHVVKLDADLDGSRTKDLEFRKKNFKTLLLKWHPDKNTGGMGEAESSAQANEVFKHLLARRDGYLAE